MIRGRLHDRIGARKFKEHDIRYVFIAIHCGIFKLGVFVVSSAAEWAATKTAHHVPVALLGQPK